MGSHTLPAPFGLTSNSGWMELIESPEELLLLIEFRARGILNMASYLIPGIAGAAPVHL